ncbi:coil containing protein [Vibrio phage 1.071.A._10N.286.46.A12]|nr:coil containing protein [Vibrio phage 1.071.A._10N.286.46.A12]
MEFLEITEGMLDNSLDDARKLYLFLGVSEESIDKEMWLYREGEELDWGGWFLGPSESGRSMHKGDILIKHSSKIKIVREELAFLVKDSIAADKYESLLDEIYQSGTLNAHMESKYREVMIKA